MQVINLQLGYRMIHTNLNNWVNFNSLQLFFSKLIVINDILFNIHKYLPRYTKNLTSFQTIGWIVPNHS